MVGNHSSVQSWEITQLILPSMEGGPADMTAGRHHGLHRGPSQLSLTSPTPSMVSLLPLRSVTMHSETDYGLVAEGLD